MNVKFSDITQSVFLNSQKQSCRLKHGYIGTEHLLLGILNVKSAAKAILNNMGVTEEIVYNLVCTYEGVGDIELQEENIPLTPRTKVILEQSIKIANEFNHEYVTPEHILLAILEEGQGVCSVILSELKVSFKETRKEILKYFKVDNKINQNEVDELNDDYKDALLNHINNLDKRIDELKSTHNKTKNDIENMMNILYKKIDSEFKSINEKIDNLLNK